MSTTLNLEPGFDKIAVPGFAQVRLGLARVDDGFAPAPGGGDYRE